MPRKTFMGSLRSLASALPQVAEDGDGASGLGRQLHGVRSHIPGSAAALSPSRVARLPQDAREQLVEVSPAGWTRCLAARCHFSLCASPRTILGTIMQSLTCDGLLQIKSSAIVQALRARDSMRLGSTAPLQSRSSCLTSRSSAMRANLGSAAQHGLLSRASLAQGNNAAGQAAGLNSRSSQALTHQRNLDMAARRAAMYSTQKLSSMRSTSLLPSPDASNSQWQPGNLYKEGTAADGPAAASPFLSVVLPTKD